MNERLFDMFLIPCKGFFLGGPNFYQIGKSIQDFYNINIALKWLGMLKPFHQLGPLGRVGRVGQRGDMSVCLCVYMSPSHAIFFHMIRSRPLIGPQVT